MSVFSHLPMTLTLKQLQAEHKEWSERNFEYKFPDDQTFWKPIFGIMEEMGELTHHLLKRSQGIRGSSAEHTEKAKDAIGDLVIFLAGACSSLGFDLQEIVETTWKEVSQRDYKKDEELKGTTDIFHCQLCGEPMPPGEEMFLYHGNSGPCPEKKSAVVAYNPPIPIDPFPVFGYFTLNGEEHKALTPELSYEHICSLAGLKPEHAPTIVARWKGTEEDTRGSKILCRGQSIKVRDGMRISACYTGNA